MAIFRAIAARHATLAALLACTAVSTDCLAADDLADRRRIAPAYDELKQRAVDRGAVPVFARFTVDGPDERTLAQRRAAGRDRLARAMAGQGIRAFAQYRRSGLSAFFVDSEQLDALLDSGLVDAVWESKLRKAYLQQSNSLIDTAVARGYGLDGAGAVVVVLDTGIDADHPTFDDRVAWEACFSTNLPPPYNATNLCPAGTSGDGIYYSQTGPGAAALTKCPLELGCWHGTHVASIAAGSNSTYTGMAPAAGIIAIQVFSRFDSTQTCGPGNSPCVLSFDHDQLSALEYVADLAATYSIASVNMSLGGGRYFSACDSSEPSFVPVVDALEALGIVIAAASGNDDWDDSMGHPACLSKVISVGSVVDTNDTVSSFSNGAAFLDLLAPGEWTTAAYPGSAYASARGTSMATPHVAGAIALVRQTDMTLTYAETKSLLVTNGSPVLDTRNGLTFPRLDLGLLAQALFGGLAGDADNDGDLDATDLLLVQRHLTGAIMLGAAAVLRCDLHPAGSPDGKLDASDLILLEQLLLAP